MTATIDRCDYANDYGDCGRRGARIELEYGGHGHYCREHTAWLAERGEPWCVAE